MKSVLVVTSALALVGCTIAKGEGKPILTEAATKKALAACGASGGRFIRSKTQLPSFRVRSRESEIGRASPTPTQTCMYQRLQPYRYDLMQMEDPTPAAS